jgi:hypothetical protein
MSCTICAAAALALIRASQLEAKAAAATWLPANGTAVPPVRPPDGLEPPRCPPVRVGSLTAALAAPAPLPIGRGA